MLKIVSNHDKMFFSKPTVLVKHFHKQEAIYNITKTIDR